MKLPRQLSKVKYPQHSYLLFANSVTKKLINEFKTTPKNKNILSINKATYFVSLLPKMPLPTQPGFHNSTLSIRDTVQ